MLGNTKNESISILGSSFGFYGNFPKVPPPPIGHHPHQVLQFSTVLGGEIQKFKENFEGQPPLVDVFKIYHPIGMWRLNFHFRLIFVLNFKVYHSMCNMHVDATSCQQALKTIPHFDTHLRGLISHLTMALIQKCHQEWTNLPFFSSFKTMLYSFAVALLQAFACCHYWSEVYWDLGAYWSECISTLIKPELLWNALKKQGRDFSSFRRNSSHFTFLYAYRSIGDWLFFLFFSLSLFLMFGWTTFSCLLIRKPHCPKHDLKHTPLPRT